MAKGGRTEAIQAAFMRHDLEDWEDAERHVVPYQRAQVERFSPNTLAILEIRTRRDLEVLEKIYANSVLLGDDGPDGWGIKYAREFDMTNDSKLFPPRPQWEAEGYRPDEYGRWVGPEGDVALPLYEGRMIGQFDFSEKGWVSGKGRTAVWREIPWEAKVVEPQYLMALDGARDARQVVLPSETGLHANQLGHELDERLLRRSWTRCRPATASFFVPVEDPQLVRLHVVWWESSTLSPFDFQARRQTWRAQHERIRHG